MPWSKSERITIAIRTGWRRNWSGRNWVSRVLFWSRPLRWFYRQWRQWYVYKVSKFYSYLKLPKKINISQPEFVCTAHVKLPQPQCVRHTTKEMQWPRAVGFGSPIFFAHSKILQTSTWSWSSCKASFLMQAFVIRGKAGSPLHPACCRWGLLRLHGEEE